MDDLAKELTLKALANPNQVVLIFNRVQLWALIDALKEVPAPNNAQAELLVDFKRVMDHHFPL